MTPCKLWTGHMSGDGYGLVTYQGKRRRAHRLEWELAFGPIAPGLCVCHKCDTPKCVNLDHLFLGTHRDNMADMSAKRRRHGEKAPSAKLTAEKVEDIRAWAEAGYSCYQLAPIFGISKSQVNNITRCASWT